MVLDNLSTHKTKLVEGFLGEHPCVTLQFTLTYSSWLNQVELWLRRVQRACCRGAIFKSTADLARKLCRYIDAHAERAKPFRWKYSNPARRVAARLRLNAPCVSLYSARGGPLCCARSIALSAAARGRRA